MFDFRRWFPLIPDPHTYWVPWVKFTTPEGVADGPMIRQGNARRELLAWTEKAPAEAAARALAQQTGGSWRVQEARRKDLVAACRQYAFGGRLVAVVLRD